MTTTADTAKNDFGCPEHGTRIVWDGHIAYSLEHMMALEADTWERTVFTMIVVYGDRGYCVSPADLDWWIHQPYIQQPLDVARFLAIPTVSNVRRYRYRPGDRIVVRINYRLSMADVDRVQEIVASKLGIPNMADVLILDAGSDIKVLRNTTEGPQ